MSVKPNLSKLALLTTLSISAYLSFPEWAIAKDCRTPVISGPPAWPPLVIPDGDTGNRFGLAVDTNREVLKEIGATARLDPSKPWNRVLRDLETGEIDMIFALLDSEERRKKFTYTDVWAHDTYGVVTLKGKELSYSTIEDLKHLKGAYYAYLKIPPPLNKLLENTTDFQSINNVASLYKILHQGRVDYLIVSVAAFFWFTPEEYKKSDFKVVENSVIKLPVYMAISKQSPCVKYVEEINAALHKKRDSIKKSLSPSN
ncbi:MAG: transporter substrate-binding domain-containing protein [Sneathiella sp.]